MEDYTEGYPFIFQMNDRSSTDGLLENTLQYRFKSTKSNHTYIVRVEKYKQHCYCLKFYDKANSESKNKYSLRTNTFEPRTIFYTLFHIMLDVLSRDFQASFFFIGAEDEKDVLGQATRRYRVYMKFVSSIISDEKFIHYAVNSESLYILINRNSAEKATKLVNEIREKVIIEYSRQ